jgi:hypothetical protein
MIHIPMLRAKVWIVQAAKLGSSSLTTSIHLQLWYLITGASGVFLSTHDVRQPAAVPTRDGMMLHCTLPSAHSQTLFNQAMWCQLGSLPSSNIRTKCTRTTRQRTNDRMIALARDDALCLPAGPYYNVYFLQLGINETTIGVLAALRTWIPAVAAFMWSGLADRYQAHKLLMLAGFILSTCLRTGLAVASTTMMVVVLVSSSELCGAGVGPIVDAAVIAACTEVRAGGTAGDAAACCLWALHLHASCWCGGRNCMHSSWGVLCPGSGPGPDSLLATVNRCGACLVPVRQPPATVPCARVGSTHSCHCCRHARRCA